MQHVFQSFWFGNTLSPYETLCLRSFIDHGHAFELYTYTPDLRVPDGVRLRDAAEILDESEYFIYQDGVHTGSHAAFSNLFRYALLAKRGGWWVDTDVICLSDDIPAFDDFFAWEDDEAINGAVLYFGAGDPIMLRCLNEAKKKGKSPAFGEIGFYLVTQVIREAGRGPHAQQTGRCYPLHWREFLDPLLPAKTKTVKERTRSSLFLHLWNEMFRLHAIPKTMLPPRGSFLRQLADRHQIDGWSAEHDAGFLEYAVSLQSKRIDLQREVEQLSATVKEQAAEIARLSSELLKL